MNVHHLPMAIPHWDRIIRDTTIEIQPTDEARPDVRPVQVGDVPRVHVAAPATYSTNAKGRI